MNARLFAGLIVACAMLGSAVAAESGSPKAEVAEKPSAASGLDSARDEAPDPYDASWSPEKAKPAAAAKPDEPAPKAAEAAKPEKAESAAARPSPPDDAKPADSSKAVDSAKAVESAKTVEAPKTEAPTTEAPKTVETAKKTKPADAAAQAARPDAKPASEPKVKFSAIPRPAPQPAASTPKSARSPSTVGAREESPAEPSARRRAGDDPSAARPVRVTATSDVAKPSFAAMPTAPARRPAAAPPAVMAAAQSTPISGGILCGGGSKWRCNWLEKEHDKFYKFTKGHNWTDQTMATDFCASEKQMRVASATRIKSNPGGCCGFVVIQVTCRR